MPLTKTAKVRMRITPDIAREVQALADLEHRDIQDQYRCLIAEALQARKVRVHGTVAERRRAMPQVAAEAELPMTPIAANRRTAPQEKLAG